MNSSSHPQADVATVSSRSPKSLLLLLGAALALSAPGQPTAPRLAGVVARASQPSPAAATEPSETFRFAGKVVDAQGRPVAGATLEAYVSHEGAVVNAELELKQQLTTGADGSFDFVLPRGAAEVVARKAGLAPAGWTQWNQSWDPAQDTTNETLVLTTPGLLAGTVVDEADKPVADAEVWVSIAYLEQTTSSGLPGYAYLHGQAAHHAFSARTGTDGKFRIENFPAGGSADLSVTKAGKVQRAIEREHIGPDTLFHPGEDDIKLVVEPAGSIEGKITVQETGKPLPGAKLSLARNQPGYFAARTMESASSGADGTFVLRDLAPGNYMLQGTLGTNTVPEWVADPVAVTVEAGKTARDVQLAAVAGGFLKAVVLGKEDMSFVSKATIQANKGAYRASGTTGTNGAVLFRLPPGTYQVYANRGEARGEGVSLTIEAGETNRHEFLLSPPPRLVGTIRDPAGQPARGLAVSILGSYGPGSTGNKTDENGRFEIPWNPQRFSGPNNTTPCLLVRDAQHNLVACQDIEPGSKPLELQLEPGLTVAGRVEDPNGKPLTNATIQVYLWLGNTGFQVTPKPFTADPQGRFQVTALPVDHRCSFDANAQGYGSADANAEREDSSTNRVELSPMVLKPANYQLAGRVLDADDKPVARANLYIYGQGQPNTSVRSDAKGRFKVEAVCEGTIQITANGRNAHGSTSAQAGDTNVVVQLGVQQFRSVREYYAPQRTMLKGQVLPDLTVVHLAAEACPADQPLLLCLFDQEQRPSRRVLRALGEQQEALKQKGVALLGVQAAVTSAEAFKEWKDASAVPFPVGYVSEKSDKTRWAAGVETLPWLILTDKQHRVVAEGFSLEELDAQLKALSK